MKAKRRPLSKESKRLLRSGVADVKAGRMTAPLTEKRVREMIYEELATQPPAQFFPVYPAAEPVSPFAPAVVCYMCQFPSGCKPVGWDSASITWTLTGAPARKL